MAGGQVAGVGACMHMRTGQHACMAPDAVLVPLARVARHSLLRRLSMNFLSSGGWIFPIVLLCWPA